MDRQSDLATLRQRWYDMGFYGSRTLSQEMLAGAEKHSDVRMVFHSDENPREATLGEMADLSRRLATGLRALGLKAGDVIGVQVPNWLEGVVTYQAAMHLGLVIVPIIHIYGAAEVGFILRQSGAKALVAPAAWRNINYEERINEVRESTDIEHVIIIGDDSGRIGVPWSSLVTDTPIDPHVGDPDQVCVIVYTSGTTAEPKGVQHTHNTLLAEIKSIEAFLYTAGRSVALAAFPAGHIAGVLSQLRMFVFGVNTILMDQWNADDAAMLVEKYGVTNTAGAPIFLRTLMDSARARGHDVKSIRNYMVGAASVPPALVEESHNRGLFVYRAYGSSEHPVVTTGTPDDPLDKRMHTDGRLTPGNEVRFVDDDFKEVPTGSEGEIAVRGPEQFVGYRDSSLDETSFLPGGWFLTGDIGRIDADGYLTITDRKKDVIIRGGENIASKEVEDILARHPSVAEAAVVGMPDEKYGERVCAFVVLQTGASIDLTEVQQHFITEKVARQKTPERIIVVPDFPRAMSGKVKKFELRAQLKNEFR